MTWNSIWPIGNVSVRTNRATGNQNTSYIETTMGNDVVGTNAAGTKDHFWDVSGNLDGHHRFMKMPKFTVGGSLANPNIGADIDGVQYLRQVSADNTRTEGYYKNADGIYQHIPSFASGTVIFTGVGNYVNIFPLPDNSYGEIFIWQVLTNLIGKGIFITTGGRTEGYMIAINNGGGIGPGFGAPVQLANTGIGVPPVDANLKGAGVAATYNYRITWRGI